MNNSKLFGVFSLLYMVLKAFKYSIIFILIYEVIVMVDGKTFKESLAEEKQKLKEMDAKKRWKYFKDYYLIWTVAILAVLICFFSWLFGRVLFEKETVSKGVSINLYLSDEDYFKLTDGYMNFIGADKRKQKVDFGLDTFIDFGGSEQVYTAYEDQMVIYAQVAAGAIYYFITDESAMKGLRASDLIVSPDQLLSAETIDMLEEKEALVMVDGLIPEMLKEEYGDVYAINLTKLGYSVGDEDTYLLFTAACPDDGVYPQSLVDFFDNL